jgi:glutamate--cysteine ligase
LLKGRLIGLEKESLRAAADGHIAQTPHPSALGAALTHGRITTDFSEALMELITVPHASVDNLLGELELLHQYVYQNIGSEMLWPTSMPCLLSGEESIPIAEYGDSNAGLMKTIYRRGLVWRYGKVMQAIAGVHYNYSLPEPFWRSWQAQEKNHDEYQDFVNAQYFSMLRNLQRCGWIIPYLFGASPAVCESFLNGKATTLSYLGQGTYYEPFATSLRMGDIGYTNKKEGKTGVKASYDSLEKYTAILKTATETACPEYAKIGVVVNDEYRQLNTNLLQIENEYYSTVRPKAIPEYMEKPVNALRRQGVQYLELRSLDVNAFEPLGVSRSQLYFLEAFMLYTLLQESPNISAAEAEEIDDNLLLVAHCGRDPELRLKRGGELVSLRDWASGILGEMQSLCTMLDKTESVPVYSLALEKQQEKIYRPELTPSAQMLDIIKRRNLSFFEYAMAASLEYKEWFCSHEIPADKKLMLDQMSRESLAQQAEIEAADNGDFAQFLEKYFAQ